MRYFFGLQVFVCASTLSASEPTINHAFVDAVASGQNRLVEKFLAEGVSPDSTNGLVPAIVKAVGNEKISTVKLLLERGANPNALTDELSTPLFEAAATGNVVIIQMLLDAGTLINARSAFGDTALFRAVGYNKIDAVRYLLKRGADPKVKSSDGTPLEAARRLGHRKIMKVLIEAGAK